MLASFPAWFATPFRARGHDAWSCDLLPTERLGPHLQRDVLEVLDQGWDLMLAFPPCTYLTRAGDRWYANSPERLKAALFVRVLAAAPIPRIAIENPRGALNRLWRRPDQVVQPWYWGDGETKATCLWLKGLPPLMATVISTGRVARVHRVPPGPERWKERSRTLPSFAEAMATQWSGVLLDKPVHFNTTHGHAARRTGTYRSWECMKARCLNPNDPSYSGYGGRGISVCERWRASFEIFLEDMGPRPLGKTLDRVDNNGNYEPGNCRWSSGKEQRRNTRANQLVIFGGQVMPLVALSEQTGVPYQRLHERIVRRGWTVEDAISKAPRGQAVG